MAFRNDRNATEIWPSTYVIQQQRDQEAISRVKRSFQAMRLEYGKNIFTGKN
jgi:hypothetical protein